MIANQRALRFDRLAAGCFDVLVVGGGIIGAGIARDAAMRGLKVALVERGDFAGGTSSKTSKLIHGGLRYLEQGKFGLVAESLRERHILHTVNPTLVHPLPLMLPIYEGNSRPAWQIGLGLGLYDLLSGDKGLQKHALLSPRQAMAHQPALSPEHLKGAGFYTDCQMDDARLCLANILQAEQFGAVCVNYARLGSLLKSEERVCGGVAEDLCGERVVEIKAEVVVNATGPWGDGLRRLSDKYSSPRLAPTKGIHLVVPPIVREGLFIEARRDRRMFFILPWQGMSLIGTTESPIPGSLDLLQATSEEVAYLLEETNRALPGARLTSEDVVATFAGARPLLSFRGSATRASREHRIEVDSAGLISVLGGKYTTFRAIAQQAVDCIVRRIRRRTEQCLTDQVSLLESLPAVSLEMWEEATRLISSEQLSRFLIRYGAGTIGVLQAILQDKALIAPLCPHHPYLAAEVVGAIQREQACTITDFLLRRTPMSLSRCQALESLDLMEDLFQRYGGLTPHQTAKQRSQYQQTIAQGLEFRETRMASTSYASR